MPAPHAEPRPLSAADRAACRAAIRAGSKSFHAASLLLPPRVRPAARALYAFCRASDDLVDCEAGPGGAVAALRARLAAIYDGRPADLLADRAFAAVVAAHRIPRALPEALIEGFAWDEAGRRYDTLDALLAYAARVASTVGVMMTLIMGRREAAVLARAADLGLAMQLTNIARDVGEDARRGRVYLPAAWLAEVGLDAEALIAAPRHGPALAAVVRRLVETADGFYAAALGGVAGLPLGCRPAIRSAALIYREIGREIARAGFDSVGGRARTGTLRKLELMAYATATPFRFVPVGAAPAHPAVRALVEAAAEPAAGAPRGFDARFGRFIELMHASELRQRQWTAAARGRA